MQVEITNTVCAVESKQQAAMLCVTAADGSHTTHAMNIHETVIIGSGNQCSLLLSGDGVANMHCSLQWDEDGFWLQHWGSDHDTLLDGKQVTGGEAIQSGSTIRIGAHTIQLLHEDTDPTQETTIQQDEASSARSDQIEAQVTDSQHLSNKDLFSNEFALPPVRSLSDVPDQDTFDLLRAEVEQLQFELAEREAQLAEVLATKPEPEVPRDGPSFNQLLERLEGLLDELDRSDERMATLEELLRMAEEANCDEQEERRQLESWLGDIESVIDERETMREAEMNSLKARAATLRTERDQLMQQLTQPASGGNSTSDSEESSKLRLQVEHLQNQLEEEREIRARQQEELQEREVQLSEATSAESTLREEQLKLAEERAALSRLRAEFTAKEVANEIRPQSGHTDIDNRVREFREHLREIHEEEKQDHGSRSLSNRIGRLWKRVEAHQ
jgi:DNA repair exonuclease SbcCD ATPase subunit